MEKAATAPDIGMADQTACGNILLRALPAAQYAALAPHLERIPFAVDDLAGRAGLPIAALLFPESGIAAVLDPLDDGRKLAVGLVGNEGFVGWPMLLGDDRWPHDIIMRAAPGTMLRLRADIARLLIGQDPALRDILLRFVNVFTIQMGRTIISSLLHPVARRMARWILLYHDRLGVDEIHLTHEEFRLMLGVRRSSVTEALHLLESDRAVRALRGRVIVRDRAKLTALAEETYGRAENEYHRLFDHAIGGRPCPGQPGG